MSPFACLKKVFVVSPTFQTKHGGFSKVKLCCFLTSCDEIILIFKNLVISLKTGGPLARNFCTCATLLTISSPPRFIQKSLVAQKPFSTTSVDSGSWTNCATCVSGSTLALCWTQSGDKGKSVNYSVIFRRNMGYLVISSSVEWCFCRVVGVLT